MQHKDSCSVRRMKRAYTRNESSPTQCLQKRFLDGHTIVFTEEIRYYMNEQALKHKRYGKIPNRSNSLFRYNPGQAQCQSEIEMPRAKGGKIDCVGHDEWPKLTDRALADSSPASLEESAKHLLHDGYQPEDLGPGRVYLFGKVWACIGETGSCL